MSLSQLDRELMEQYMRWLPTYRSKLTGAPLAVTTIKHEINAIGAFCRDTAIWGCPDVPGRPLVSTRDSPRRPETIPRYLPQHDLDALMDAVTALPDRHQRAALLVLRWSGARRDEVRRLPTDCLDTYPGGHPRLRIPVGKGHAERIIPLHPVAAAALRSSSAWRPPASRSAAGMRPQAASRSTCSSDAASCCRRPRCSTTRFGPRAPAGLVDDNGVPTVSAHRLRHTLGTQLAEGGARIQTIMAILGHRSTSMAMIYTRISDPEIRRQYETALANGQRIAGPAAEALLYRQIDQHSLDWLQTNFLKTELELGHCLRLPAEGPCECDLVLSCPKFLTSSDYAPRLHARLEVEQTLIDDATARGWSREVERHQATARRLTALLNELDHDTNSGAS
jgi:integrase